jgi:hypothetical protein
MAFRDALCPKGISSKDPGVINPKGTIRFALIVIKWADLEGFRSLEDLVWFVQERHGRVVLRSSVIV